MGEVENRPALATEWAIVNPSTGTVIAGPVRLDDEQQLQRWLRGKPKVWLMSRQVSEWASYPSGDAAPASATPHPSRPCTSSRSTR